MTEVAQQSDASTAGSGQSTTEQAKEKVQETAQQVQDKALEVKGRAGDRFRQQLDERSTEAGSQLRSSADAIRQAGQQLRNEGSEGPAKITDAVADRAERLGGYLADANADRMLGDVERLARRQPWLVAFGGLALGFLASRFVKASSSTRYQSGAHNGSTAGEGARFEARPGLPRPTSEPAMASFSGEGSYVAASGAKEEGSHGRSDH